MLCGTPKPVVPIHKDEPHGAANSCVPPTMMGGPGKLVKEAGPLGAASFPSPLSIQSPVSALRLPDLFGIGETVALGVAGVGMVEDKLTAGLTESEFWGVEGIMWLPLQANVKTRNVKNRVKTRTA